MVVREAHENDGSYGTGCYESEVTVVGVSKPQENEYRRNGRKLREWFIYTSMTEVTGVVVEKTHELTECYRSGC